MPERDGDGLTPGERLLRAIFGAPCDGTRECAAPVHQFPCEASDSSTPPGQTESGGDQ